jgi:hypothetical protein
VRHVALGNLQGKGHSPEGGHDKATGSTPNRQERRTPVTWDQFGSNVTEPETARLLMAMAMIKPPESDCSAGSFATAATVPISMRPEWAMCVPTGVATNPPIADRGPATAP